MIETGTDPKLSGCADDAGAEAIREYIKEQAKWLWTWWGDSESNASDWDSEFNEKGEEQ